jgi:hypothetical protein
MVDSVMIGRVAERPIGAVVTNRRRHGSEGWTMSGPARSRPHTAVVFLTAGLLLTACSTTKIPVQTTITPSAEPVPTDAAPGTQTGAETGQTPADPSLVTDPTDAAEAMQLATRIAIQPTDLPSPWAGMGVQVSPNGDKVTGSPSLENCGYRFGSEQDRVTRHAVTVTDADGKDVGVFNEVVFYDTPAHAAAALREWRSSVNGCRKGTIFQRQGEDQPRLRVESESTATNSALPVTENTVTMITATALSSPRARLSMMTVLQLQDRVLDIVWLVSPTPLTRSKISSGTTLAAATGRRLTGG